MSDDQEDQVVILNPNDDDDSTVFQSDEERKKLERDLLDLDEEDSSFDPETDTTMQMTIEPSPYWKRIFG